MLISRNKKNEEQVNPNEPNWPNTPNRTPTEQWYNRIEHRTKMSVRFGRLSVQNRNFQKKINKNSIVVREWLAEV